MRPQQTPIVLRADQLTITARAVLGLGRYTDGHLQARILHHVHDELMVELRTHVLATVLVSDTETATVHTPATWWEHWKHAHAHRWYARRLIARWPVRYQPTTVTVDLTRYATYPHADLPPHSKALGLVVLKDRTDVVVDSPWPTGTRHRP